MLMPNGHVEALGISLGGVPLAVFCHKEGTDIIVRDDPSGYGRRITFPHLEVFESRTYDFEDDINSRARQYLDPLLNMKPNTRSDDLVHRTAFAELFRSAEGHYYNRMELRDLDEA